MALARSIDDTIALERGAPGGIEIGDPADDLAEMVVRLAMLDQSERRGILDAGRGEAFGCVERVRVDARLLGDRVLEEPMGHDHRASDELLPPGDALTEDGPVMGEELEVEVRHPHAGVAVAGRGLTDVTQPAAEREVGPLDRIHQARPVDGRRDHVGERRIALELRQPEGRPERSHDRVHEVGQDVLRVIELDPGEVARVAGDVGDHEAGGFGRVAWVEHRVLRVGLPGHHRAVALDLSSRG